MSAYAPAEIARFPSMAENAKFSDLANISRFGNMAEAISPAMFSFPPNHRFADLIIVAARIKNEEITENIKEPDTAHTAAVTAEIVESFAHCKIP